MINIHNSDGVTMQKTEYIRIKLITAAAAAVLLVTAAYPAKISNLLNLTIRINTEGDDYAPSLTEDGSTAVFNSRMPQEKSHNIFICKNKNGLWGDPYPIFANNSEFNDETPFISADGKTILFASDRPGGFAPSVTSDGKRRITFDLYISRLVEGKWTEPEMLKGTVNTNMNERAPGLSIDGKTLYFTRWPYNNPGKSKIYSAKLEDGGFNDVRELPESINKGNYEIGFRPSYKSGRYYFASRKPGGLGAWDIYYTTISGNGFTAPVNAGAGINTPYDDMYYSESKINSMICSDRSGGLGKFDLYSSVPAVKGAVSMTKQNGSNNPPSILNIKAIDKKNGKLMKNSRFRILVMAEREKESVFLRKAEVKSGSKGIFTLTPKDDADSVVIEPLSKSYSACSVKIQIIPGQTQNITLYIGSKSKSSKRSNPCTEAEVKSSVESKTTDTTSIPALKVIFFKFNSADFSTEYIPQIHSLVEFMRANPEYYITISGYSDPAGSVKSNDKLSMKRANNVSDLIRSLDIPAERITVQWFGESKSVSVKKGPRYYCLDRKVEISFKK